MLQGNRSILGGIQNLQLASDMSVPTLLVRQQGQLPPPLLRSTLHHTELSSSDMSQQSQKILETPAAAAATPAARSPARFSRLAASAFKPPADSPSASALLAGRLNRQSRPQGSLEPGLGVARASAAAAGFGQLGSPAADQSTPEADNAAAGEGNQEPAGTSGTMTQDEWNAFMQSGSTAPTSTSKAAGSKTTGRKKAVRPVLKKQRMNTIVLD